MVVPQQIPFSSVPTAGVYTTDSVSFLMKTGADSAVDLATALPYTSIIGSVPVQYFPNAALTLG